MNVHRRNKPEVLAPAGNLRGLKTAVDYGADAVYCGGKAFGMRSAPKNLSLADFEEGAVGAGRGTVCHGLKGGIGSASRLMEYDGKTYTLGVLVQSNYGRLSDLRIDGRPVGKEIASGALEEDKGSIIVVMGTDLPLSDRQIKRVLRRAGVGLARVGSFTGHGSGEVFVGFSTANAMDDDDKAIRATESFREDLMNGPFRAMAEATEEAVLNSMSCSVAVGDVKSLADYLPQLLKH